jgi:hypothetical protein
MSTTPRFINSADVCFHSLLPPNITTITNDCSPCEPDWNIDNSMWHSPSCTLPDNLYLGLLVGTAPLLLITATLLFAVGLKKQSTARSIAWLSAGSNVTMIFSGISLYVQNGYYEGCTIALMVLSTFTVTNVGEIWWSFLSPVYAVEGRDLTQARKSLKRYVGLSLIVVYVLCIALAIVCRNPTQEYNILMSTFFLYALLLNYVFSTMQLISHTKLEKVLSDVLQNRKENQTTSSASQTKIMGLLTRVRTIKSNLSTSYLNNAIALLPGPVTYFVLNVVPYQWIVLVIVFLVYQLASIGILRYLVTSTRVTNSSPSNSRESNNDKKNSKKKSGQANNVNGDGGGVLSTSHASNKNTNKIVDGES